MSHDFDECLAASHENSKDPIWEEVYRKAFSDFASMTEHPSGGFWQGAGVDRSITLRTGKVIYVDEKFRRPGKDGKIYDDILLEYISNDKTGAPGWVCKPLLADYIAYQITGLRRVVMLPVIQLQIAWARHGEDWRRLYGELPSDNHTYLTWNCPVPETVLFGAIGQALRLCYGTATPPHSAPPTEGQPYIGDDGLPHVKATLPDERICLTCFKPFSAKDFGCPICRETPFDT
jgi:hypothetical protein